ncbi:MAG: hypothetical protein IJM71_02220 [Clostridia bacterium]|nr:hypothetical protein [Clostridia bacterium]
MSFLIAVHVNEGIVLASDRRTTYTNTQTIDNITVQRIGIHTTNSTDKTFICPNGAGISCCGDASLLGKPITGFIQDMIRSEISEECQIEDMPQLIIDYFGKLSMIPDTSFVVAGYDSVDGQKVQTIFKLNVKSKKTERIDTSSQGATWDGETLTLTRLIQNVAVKTADNHYLDLPFEEILWSYFTLQDAIDFARYAVETTIQTMRFKNVVETVGGAVDVLVITPDKTAWLQKKSLK